MPSPPKVPKGPSGTELATQQTAANLDAAAAQQRASLIDQTNPYSSIKYTQTGTGPGGLPTYRSNVKFSPEQQLLLNQLINTQTTAGGAANPLLQSGNYGQAPDLSTGVNSRVTQRLGQQQAFFQPVFDTQFENLDTQMRNQGLLPGMPGYDRAIRELRDTQNRAVSSHISEFQPQAFQQSLTEYQLPALMAQQLAGFGAPANISEGQFAPGSLPGSNLQPANVIGAGLGAYQNQLSAYDRQKDQYDQMIRSAMDLGGSIIAAPFTGGASLGRIGSSLFNQFRPAGGDWVTSVMRA